MNTRSRSPRPVEVCLVSPTYFHPDSVLGGGERFVEELARALAERTTVRFVSFGPREQRNPLPADRERGLERVILPRRGTDKMTPFSAGLFRELTGARVIHCHQYWVLPTFLSVLTARFRGVPVYVTDLGGGGWTPAYQLDPVRWVTGFLHLSRYAASRAPDHYPDAGVIGGGIDPEHYPDRPRDDGPHPPHDGFVMTLGRLLPHKGVHHLVAALPEGVSPEVPLEVVGPWGDEAYLRSLRRQAAGKPVTFRGALPDEEVRDLLRRAMALVHPTPVDRDGSAGVHELFGLVLVEAMAGGCPVIATEAASLPEIVVDGESGLLVPPNDPRALSRAIRRLADDPALWRRLSRGARRRALEHFTWDRVAERCLAAYRTGRVPEEAP